MQDSFQSRSLITSRQLGLLIEAYRKWSPLLILSGICFFLWMFVLFFVPPVIAADLLWKEAYVPFYGPLFLSVFCLASFCLRHLRRGFLIAVAILIIFALHQLRIYEWWHLPTLLILLFGVEYLLTHR